jgi:AcrR family transcriptional regulator
MQNKQTPMRTGRKTQDVLLGARAVFLRDGYAGATVDTIAREAEVSKATVYSYFADKETLFLEVLREECERMAQNALDDIDQDTPCAEVLKQAGYRLIFFLQSDFSQKMFRVCVSESERFPELGKHYYLNGPKMGQGHVVDFLQKAAGRGEISVTDYELAADQFLELCKADIFVKIMFGVQTYFSDAEIERVVSGAVETFMARYRAT